MKRFFIGADPGGSSGAIAVLYIEGNDILTHLCIEFSKSTLKEWYEFLLLSAGDGEAVAIIENVHTMPDQGVSSAMKFGINVGHIEMGLTAAGIPFGRVTPQKWMKYYGMKKDKNETKTEWKKRLRERLQELMPSLKVTNNNADAYLIAYYNWKTYT